MRFPATVTFEPYVSIDAHHKVTYGTATQLACKYTDMSKRELTHNGSEIVTVSWLLFPAGTKIDYRDRITLPSGKQPPITSISSIVNQHTKETCVEVYLTHKTGYK